METSTPPTEYEIGFEAGVAFVLHEIEQQMLMPPYSEHEDILQKLLDHLSY